MWGIFALSGNHFQVKYNTLYFIFIKCVLCEAVGSADQNHKTFKTFLFFTRKKKQKNLPSATSAKGGGCSRARLKISKGQVVFFEKITQKISTFKPLPIFILSVLSSLPKARLSKNKIFIVFRFSSVTDKTTQNKKDTREVSRIFYSAIAPFNGTKRFEFLL